MTENRYNKVTLAPENEEEQKLFFQFRSTDIVEMHMYGAIFTSGMAVVGALSLLTSTGKEEISIFILSLLCALSRWLILVIGSRFKDKMNYMIAGVFLFEQLAIVAAIEMVVQGSVQMTSFGYVLTRQVTFY